MCAWVTSTWVGIVAHLHNLFEKTWTSELISLIAFVEKSFLRRKVGEGSIAISITTLYNMGWGLALSREGLGDGPTRYWPSITTDGRPAAGEKKTKMHWLHHKTWFLFSPPLRAVHQLYWTTHNAKEHHVTSREGANPNIQYTITCIQKGKKLFWPKSKETKAQRKMQGVGISWICHREEGIFPLIKLWDCTPHATLLSYLQLQVLRLQGRVTKTTNNT